MKKLLLIGAMLIVGATSFSAVVTPLVKSEEEGTATYSGSGNLPIESEGNIFDPTGKVTLVLNPISSAGTDGASLMFNFGAVGRGKYETLIGSFEAKVLDGVTQGGTTPKLANMSGAKIDVKLEKGTESGTAQKVTVKEAGVESGSAKNLVDLTYELSGTNGLSADGTIYNGEIKASAYRPPVTATNGNNYVAGEFIDNSVRLVFNISDLELK